MIIHALLLVAQVAAPVPSQACTGTAAAPALDHVVIVVRDLDSASVGFREHGFRLKPGRLHANGLLNRHVKFRDGTSLELMAVQDSPTDAMARDYAQLAAAGEGGVYVALTVPDISRPADAASALGLVTRRSSSGSLRFLSFPHSSPAAAVFFGAGGTPVQDPDSLTTHEPEVLGLSEAWLEGGGQLGVLLAALGARRCGPARSSDGRVGERFGLRNGSVVLLPAPTRGRPRVTGAVLQLRRAGAGSVHPHPAFWVDYRAVRR